MAFSYSPTRAVQFLSYALSHDSEKPSYWSTQGRDEPYLVDVDWKTTDAIVSLVNGTFNSRAVGVGHDARNLDYDRLTVKKVERIENARLFGEYRRARNNLLRQQIGKGVICPRIDSLGRSRKEVVTTSLLPDFMKMDLYHEINEHYVFHGTTVDRIGALSSYGFNIRQSSSENMFGAGVYGAEKSIKADQYADPVQARSPLGNRLKLILSRMLLGTPLVLDCPYNQNLPNGYDSIIADGPHWMYREFVVKEGAKVYPEYVITYTRG